MMRLSTRFYFRVAVLLLMLNFTAGGCEDDAVGLTDSAKIANNKFSSSSNLNASTPASNGRLSYTGGPSWCALSSDSTHYLEVDLGSVYILCAVATQGNSQADQWVKTYEIKSSEDRSSWNPYTEKGQDVIFQGNYDRNTEVKHYFYEGLQARYVRVYPKRHYGLVCLRLELFGQSKTDCSSTAIGVEDSSKIPNDRFTASSTLPYDVYKPSNVRLNYWLGWTPSSRDNVRNEWIQIDFGSSYFICAVATQGSGKHKEYVTKYKLKLSNNNNDWTYYTEGGTVREFVGNEDKNSIKKHSLPGFVFGKFLRLTPWTYSNWPSVRMEVYGITQVCRSSLGMENRTIADSQITASTGTASNGRLYNNRSAWCGTTLSTDYLQVDLGQSVTVTGLATQGDPSARNWVTRYHVKYSQDTTTWYDYKESGKNTKSFSGNTNQNSLFVNWFNYYVFARYIRVYPTLANGNPCMRVDFYGCVSVVAPTVALTDKVHSPPSGTVSFTCNVTGNPNPVFTWKYDKTDITSQSRIVTQPHDTVNGLTTSKLSVNVPNIDDMLSEYDCKRTNPSTRDVECTSPLFLCIVRYSGGPSSVQTATVVTKLDVPPTPTSITSKQYGRSVVINWVQPPSSSGQGAVTSFKIDYHVSGKPSMMNSLTLSSSARSVILSGLRFSSVYNVTVTPFISLAGKGLSKIIYSRARCDTVPVVVHAWSSSSFLDGNSPPTHGQLNYTSGSSWCASSNDPSPHLEVDLGTEYIICAIVTLGNSQADQWVKTYQIQTSKDQSSWSDYKEDGQVKVFDGNYDRSTEVKHINDGLLQGRYLRVLPKSHHNGTCLRLAVYGVSTRECSGTAVGVQSSLAVPDHRFTASSYYDSRYLPHFARLDRTTNGGWTTTRQDRNTAWLQIDFGDVNVICAVTTQGRYSLAEWTKTYNLRLSLTNKSWRISNEQGREKVFQGNKDRNGKVKNVLSEIAQAKLIRFVPLSYNSYPVLRVEVYGILQGKPNSATVNEKTRA